MNIYITLIVIAAILSVPLIIIAVARLITAIKTAAMLDRMTKAHNEHCDDEYCDGNEEEPCKH